MTRPVAAGSQTTGWTWPLAVCVALVAGLSIPWIWALGSAPAPIPGGAGLVVAQVALAAMVAVTIVEEIRGAAQRGRAPGPRLALAGHVLLYYTAANLVPGLRPDIRPPFFYALGLDRIPHSPTASYIGATIAAALLLIGGWVGVWLAERSPLFGRLDAESRRAGGSWWWLPRPRAALFCCLTLLVLIAAATARYGWQFDVLTTADLSITNPIDQLLVYGVFPFLALAPLLAAGALVQSPPRERRALGGVLVVAILMTLICLAVWRMRSTSIIAMLLPLGLLVLARRLRPRHFVAAVVIGVPLIYGAVTAARIVVIGRTVSDAANVSVSSVISGDAERTLLSQAMFDASYRAAGLEASAAVITAQGEGRLRPRMGGTIAAGFMQALPAWLRPSSSVAERLKSAPSHFGIFSEGDWVTTVLTEFILDFGALWLVVPACLFGLALAMIDRGMLWLGALGGMDGMLVIRLAWLVALTLEGSVADRTLLFAKAIVGYAIVLLFVGIAGRARLRAVT